MHETPRNANLIQKVRMPPNNCLENPLVIDRVPHNKTYIKGVGHVILWNFGSYDPWHTGNR